MNQQNASGKRFNVIVSILLAILLWFYVVNVENPTGDTSFNNVSIEIIGEEALSEQGLMVTDLSRYTMNVKVRGKRKSFLTLYRGAVSVVIDVSDITSSGEFAMTGDFRYNNVRISSVSSDLSATERNRFAVTVTVKPRDSKEISLEGRFEGGLAYGYDADDMELSVEEVLITGPVDVLETISHAEVVIDQEHLNTSIDDDYAYRLIDYAGNVVEDDNLRRSPETVRVTMPVVKVYEIQLDVGLVSGGGAHSNHVEYSITPSTITVSGDASILENMDKYILGEVNLAEVFSHKTITFEIPVQDGVINRSGETYATVTLSIEGLSMKSIEATQIELVGEVEGYAATILDPLPVWIRGDEALVNAVDASQIQVKVDLSGVTPAEGQQRVDAEVTLMGTADVGVVGTDYKVALLLERS